MVPLELLICPLTFSLWSYSCAEVDAVAAAVI